ncbi:hypothetical protein CGLAMM_07910 [Acetobacteraceae bacterium EV16G]|uniref:Uncharacterized protein n=1 Tax=Sorlinia euscelidii TaxID=3081148 RepID=A0ABU7U2B2_9PROT
MHKTDRSTALFQSVSDHDCRVRHAAKQRPNCFGDRCLGALQHKDSLVRKYIGQAG